MHNYKGKADVGCPPIATAAKSIILLGTQAKGKSSCSLCRYGTRQPTFVANPNWKTIHAGHRETGGADIMHLGEHQLLREVSG